MPRILVVDDEEEIRKILDEFLNRMGLRWRLPPTAGRPWPFSTGTGASTS